MPQSSVVEWIAGGTLQRQRRQKPLEDPEANTVQHHSMGPRNHSGCCPTCCSCSSCDGRSEWSTDSPSKTVRFKQPKGILKNTRRVDEEDHICCFACTLSAHCNERHTVGKNGKVYGSSKNCAPKGGKRGADDWGESKSTSNSPRGMKVASENNYTIYQTQIPPSPPQTPEQRRTLQNLSSFITKNMSRLILPSRAEVIIREDVLENASDPRPNAFFDARTGMLRVYHGPIYGNPGGSIVPLQAQHVPIGTPSPPMSAWTNPWAGMMGGISSRWPFNVSQQGGGGDQGMQNSGPPGNKYYSSGNKFNGQRNISRGKAGPVGNNNNNNNNSNNGSSLRTGDSKPMPGSFNNDDDQNGNSGWSTDNNNANDNSNDDAWGSRNDDTNNDSPDNGGQVDTWRTDNNNSNSSGNGNWGSNQNNNNTSSGDDNWGTNNNNNTPSGDDNCGTNNNNKSSGDDNWGSGPDNSNRNNNDSSSNSGWAGYKNRSNQNGTSQRIFPDATGTEFSAGSWGEQPKQESWGDKNAAQSTKNNSNDTSGW